MSLERELKKRSDSKCELCKNEENIKVYTLTPVKEESLTKSLIACEICIDQIDNPDTTGQTIGDV